MKTQEERFWDKVDIQGKNDCWNWTGAVVGDGYGSARLDGRQQPAHRVAYILGVGRLHPFRGHNVLRTCGNPLCCNPEHLIVGTLKEAQLISRITKRKDLRRGQHLLTTRQKRRIMERALRGDSAVRIHRDNRKINYKTVLNYVHAALNN